MMETGPRKRDAVGLAFGLSLLYTSPFYLPMDSSWKYWFPSVGAELFYPTAVAVAVLTPVVAACLLRRGKRLTSVRISALLAIGVLCCIAILSGFSAFGYSARGVLFVLMGGANANIVDTRWARIALTILCPTSLVIALYFLRPVWHKLWRALAILGYAYAALALLRLYPLAPPASVLQPVSARPVLAAAQPESANTASLPLLPQSPPKQVIWIIFDELDFDETVGMPGGHPSDPPMPNLTNLAHSGVSASDAYSPARDTEASIPALLSGYDLTGLDYDHFGELWLKTRANGTRRFLESDSVFGRLPNGPQSGAILGYYQPYCHVFASASPCVSARYANTGRWFDALTFFGQTAVGAARWLPIVGPHLPADLLRTFEPMYRITEDTIREFPRFLSLESKSLVFIHVNIPHAPGDYAQRDLGLPTVGDDRESYRRNLRLVDEMVGITSSTLKARSARSDILLIVSSDHWHRINSPLTPQRIPWIAWHVGESQEFSLDTRLSTIHTAELVLDFLQGHIASQSEIVPWWHDKDFFPPLMPHNFRY